MKNSNDTIGNRTRDITACSEVPQPTSPQRALLDLQADLTPRKENWFALNRRLGGAQSRSGQYWKTENLLPLLGFESRILKSVASPYAAYVTPAHIFGVDHELKGHGSLKNFDTHPVVYKVS